MAAASAVEPRRRVASNSGSVLCHSGEPSGAQERYSSTMRWHHSEKAALMSHPAAVAIVSATHVRSALGCDWSAPGACASSSLRKASASLTPASPASTAAARGSRKAPTCSRTPGARSSPAPTPEARVSTAHAATLGATPPAGGHGGFRRRRAGQRRKAGNRRADPLPRAAHRRLILRLVETQTLGHVLADVGAQETDLGHL